MCNKIKFNTAFFLSMNNFLACDNNHISQVSSCHVILHNGSDANDVFDGL